MTEIEIRTADSLADSPEPSLTLTQVRALLADATAYERAQRPLVLHAPAEPATAPQAAVHAGVDVHVPAAPTAAVERRSDRNPWPLVFMVSACSGLGAVLVTAVTNSPYAILAVFVAMAAWGTATYQLVFVREP